jgi:16S rRNA processing protein RimM
MAAQGGPEDTDRVAVGWILGPHGTSGEVRVRVFSDVPHRFDQGENLCCNGQSYRIAATTGRRSNQVILKLDGIDDSDAARGLIGQWLTAPTDSAPQLPEGEYFHYQLLGLRVVTEEHEELGAVAEIIQTGSNDVYVVSGEGGEVLVPAIAQVVRRVDLEQGVMVVRLMEGLR